MLDILECESVRARFGLEDVGELEQIYQWVEEVGIRWGQDGNHRKDFGVPAMEENTWQTGVDRFLLGMAMPGEGPLRHNANRRQRPGRGARRFIAHRRPSKSAEIASDVLERLLATCALLAA